MNTESYISNVLEKLFKYCGSLIVAFAVMNFLCSFYYNPIRGKINWKGYSAHTNEVNVTSYFGVEGYGINNIDRYGFNNEGNVTQDNAKIVCTGTSQTEGDGVNTDKNYVSLLNKYNDDNMAYNIANSGQFLGVNMSRIPKIIDNFPGVDMIVVETTKFPTLKEFKKIKYELSTGTVTIDKSFEKYTHWFLKLLRDFPYNRLVYFRLMRYLSNNRSVIREKESEWDDVRYTQLTNDCFAELIAKSNGIQLILMYLSMPVLTKDGDCELKETDIILQQKAIIQNACKKNGIVFIDMGQYFVDDFNRTKQPVNGFLNSRIATGHINVHGYKIIARVLNGKISELRAKEAVR